MCLKCLTRIRHVPEKMSETCLTAFSRPSIRLVNILEKWKKILCPLGTAILSLMFENVVSGGWICSFSHCGQVFFTAPPSMSGTRTCEYFSKNISRCNAFSVTALQPTTLFN